MKRIITDRAPNPVGPYAQAVIDNSLVYTSGQIALVPGQDAMPAYADIKAETTQVMRNLEAVLEAAGATFSDVIKTTIFVTDLAHFADVNATYGSFFPQGSYPARSTIQVAALPKGARVEIEAVARVTR